MADVSLILLFIFLAAGTFLSRSPPCGTNVLNIIFPITIIRNSQFWRKIHRHFSSHWVKCSVFGFGRFFFSEQLTIKVLLLTLGGRALYLSIISFIFSESDGIHFLESQFPDFRFLDFWIQGFGISRSKISNLRSDPQLWLQLAPSSTMLDPSLNAGMFLI